MTAQQINRIVPTDLRFTSEFDLKSVVTLDIRTLEDEVLSKFTVAFNGEEVDYNGKTSLALLWPYNTLHDATRGLRESSIFDVAEQYVREMLAIRKYKGYYIVNIGESVCVYTQVLDRDKLRWQRKEGYFTNEEDAKDYIDTDKLIHATVVIADIELVNIDSFKLESTVCLYTPDSLEPTKILIETLGDKFRPELGCRVLDSKKDPINIESFNKEFDYDSVIEKAQSLITERLNTDNSRENYWLFTLDNKAYLYSANRAFVSVEETPTTPHIAEYLGMGGSYESLF